jgi:hypothetical protein
LSFKRAEQRGDPAPFFFLFINDVKEIVVSPPPYWGASNGSAIRASGSKNEEKWPTPNWLAERREAYRIGKLRALLYKGSAIYELASCVDNAQGSRALFIYCHVRWFVRNSYNEPFICKRMLNRTFSIMLNLRLSL